MKIPQEIVEPVNFCMRMLFQKKSGARVTDQTLHPNSGKLKERLNKNMSRLPIETTKNDSR